MKNDARRQRRQQLKKTRRLKKRRELNAEALGARLDVLRALLYDGASFANWQRLCEWVEKWPDDETLQLGLDYANDHLTRWPDEFKGGCGTDIKWLSRRLDGHKEPRFDIVRLGTLRGTHITPARLKALFRPPIIDQLTGLSLNTSEFNGELTLQSERANIAHLRSLDLSGCWMRDEQLLSILQPERLPALQSLILRRNHLSDQGLIALLQSGILTRVTALNLDRANLSIGGLTRLLTHPVYPRLRTLSLRRVTALAHLDMDLLLPPDRPLALETLDLSSSGLDDGICDALAAACLPGLLTLTLAHNRIGSAGLSTLMGRDWPCLRHLDLTRNHVDHEGVRALVKSRAMPHLSSLRLGDNPLDPDITRSLIEHGMPGVSRLTAGFDPGRRKTTAAELGSMLRLTDLPEETRLIALRKLRRLDREHARRLIFALVRGHRDAKLQGDLLEWVIQNLDMMLVTDLKVLLRTLRARGFSTLRKHELKATLIEQLRDSAQA